MRGKTFVRPEIQEARPDLVSLQGRYSNSRNGAAVEDSTDESGEVDVWQIESVAAELGACENDFLIAASVVALDVLDDVVRWNAALASAYLGDDAIGADLIASFLYLDHGARPGGGGGNDLYVVARGAGYDFLPRPVCDLLHQCGLFDIAHDEVDLVELPYRFRRALSVAACSHDGGVRVPSAGRAEGAASLGVGHVRNGAAVHHIHIDGRAPMHDIESSRGELGGKGAGVGLVELAAMGFDGYPRFGLEWDGGHGGLHEGHCISFKESTVATGRLADGDQCKTMIPAQPAILPLHSGIQNLQSQLRFGIIFVYNIAQKGFEDEHIRYI